MFKLIKKYLNGYWLITVLAPVFKLFESIIELFIPMLVKSIIDKGIEGDGGLSYVYKTGWAMFGLYVVAFIMAALCQYFSAKSAFGFGTNLRRGLYRHINNLPMKDIDLFQPSTLVVRISLDTTNTQNALNRFMRLATRAPFILIGSLIMAVSINPRMSLIFFVAAALISFALYLVMKKSTPKLFAINKGHDEITRLTRENLTGARVVRAFNKQSDSEKDFDFAAEKLKKDSLKLDIISGITSPLTYLVVNVGIICILYFGSLSINTGGLTKGDVVALINYMLQILNGLVLLAMLLVLFSKAGASAKRINKVLDTKTEDKFGIENLKEIENNTNFSDCPLLVFDNVSCGYPQNAEYSLKNISFQLKKGQTLGIVGGTGSGKTTLVSLIARLYDYDGQIMLMNQDIKQINPVALRQYVGFAPQSAVLFLGTIKENITMGRQATDQEIFLALKMARADFIESLDQKVLRGGSNFSGGQRQRLCLARALLKSPSLLILDDTTSALDYSTEGAVRQQLNKLKDMTKIIVSQRIAAIKNADLIIVLEEGAAVGLGTHQQLVCDCAVYKEIVEIQENI